MNFLPESELKALLNEWVDRINTPAYIETDPVQFPLRYKLLQDVEVAAFLTATITWGNRRMILRSAEKMLSQMGTSPYDYLMSGAFEKIQSGNIHRTFFTQDFQYVCRGLQKIYLQQDSLESVFASEASMWEGITAFRTALAEANGQVFSKHISNPQANSACKRLHLALRWLVRNDGVVDAGCWKTIQPADLFIPLDVHVGRVSRALGLLQRKQSDRKAVEELTQKLRAFDAEDPVRYDFALFGIGESGENLPLLIP